MIARRCFYKMTESNSSIFDCPSLEIWKEAYKVKENVVNSCLLDLKIFSSSLRVILKYAITHNLLQPPTTTTNHPQPPKAINNHPQYTQKAKTCHKQLCYCTLNVNTETDVDFDSDMKEWYVWVRLNYATITHHHQNISTTTTPSLRKWTATQKKPKFIHI